MHFLSLSLSLSLSLYQNEIDIWEEIWDKSEKKGTYILQQVKYF